MRDLEFSERQNAQVCAYLQPTHNLRLKAYQAEHGGVTEVERRLRRPKMCEQPSLGDKGILQYPYPQTRPAHLEETRHLRLRVEVMYLQGQARAGCRCV